MMMPFMIVVMTATGAVRAMIMMVLMIMMIVVVVMMLMVLMIVVVVMMLMVVMIVVVVMMLMIVMIVVMMMVLMMCHHFPHQLCLQILSTFYGFQNILSFQFIPGCRDDRSLLIVFSNHGYTDCQLLFADFIGPA